jgi:hypothetical protein
MWDIFEWNEIPGKDEEKLRKFLLNDVGIGWARIAKIEKNEECTIVKIYTNCDCCELKLNNIKTEVAMVYNGSIIKYIAMSENNELNIYKRGKKTSDHVKKVVEKLNHLLNGKISEVIEMETSGCKVSEDYTECKMIKDMVELDPVEKELLLCTALYHDIGKSIIFPRHGPEGADVIKDSGPQDRKLFLDLSFTRYDFYFMSDLIRFHDYLEMLSTGEVSYLIQWECGGSRIPHPLGWG